MKHSEQKIILITGASAGIGRAIALRFARAGWRVALLARSFDGLESARREIEATGGEAAIFPADVANAAAVAAAADQVVARWGGIDVWINNAMVSTFAPIAQMTAEEYARITQVTYLGYVHGTLAALRHMRSRDAGTIVQIGSALAYRGIPLQSAYCGAKFAIRGFTDALRCELLHDNSNIQVIMLQLPAVNTPQFDWARNKTGFRARPLPPVVRPERIAEATFRVVQRPRRELWLGWSSLKAIVGAMVAPGLLDRWLSRQGYDGQITDERQSPDQIDNLFEPARAGHVTDGRFSDEAKARLILFNPTLMRAAIVAVLAGAAASLLFTLLVH